MNTDARNSTKWESLKDTVCWRIQPFINGRYQQSTAREVFDHVNPATEALLWQAPVGDAQEVGAAVRVARDRFDAGCWSDLPAARRIEVLLKLADLIVQHRTELALLD